jgi:ribosome-associated heat shock protein Hsp15
MADARLPEAQRRAAQWSEAQRGETQRGGGAARAPSLRLDLFRWHARFAKTRSSAQVIACEGRMRIDGRVVDRAATPVRVGNILTFAQHGRVRVIRIEALPARRGPAAEAQGCYQDLAVDNGSQQAASD